MRKLALIVLFAVACGGESTTQPAATSIAGAWDLHSVASAKLPLMLLRSAEASADLMSDVVTLHPDGTYSEVTMIRHVAGAKVTMESYGGSGTYSVGAATVTLRTLDGVVTSGTFVDDTMTLDEGGHAFVYNRR